MKIHLWSIGRAHDGYVKAGIEDFTARISHYYKTEWRIIATPKAFSAAAPQVLMEKEGEQLLGIIPKDAFVVLLDEAGKMIDSPGLAALITKTAGRATKEMIFLIGGAFGVSETVKKRADFSWSLSALVFPHQLVRLMLAEQIYRACTILNNGKYHHT